MKTNRKQLQLISAGAFLVAAVIVYLFGYAKIAFVVSGVNVAIYPAAFLALVAVVQAWRTFAAKA